MRHVIICEYAKHMKLTLFDYIEKNKDEVFRYYNTYLIGVVELKNGDEVWIMPRIEYKVWCKGRTYMKDGKLYHSGQPCSVK